MTFVAAPTIVKQDQDMLPDLSDGVMPVVHHQATVYLLGDPGYLVGDMYTMHCLGSRECSRLLDASDRKHAE